VSGETVAVAVGADVAVGIGVLVAGGGWGVLVGGGPDPQQFVQAGLLTRLHDETCCSYPQKTWQV
jgi:hypothetical protein